MRNWNRLLKPIILQKQLKDINKSIKNLHRLNIRKNLFKLRTIRLSYLDKSIHFKKSLGVSERQISTKLSVKANSCWHIDSKINLYMYKKKKRKDRKKNRKMSKPWIKPVCNTSTMLRRARIWWSPHRWDCYFSA